MARKFGSPRFPFGHSTDDASYGENGFEVIHLQVTAQNLKSIEADDPFHDFIPELDQCYFDKFVFSETWRVETKKVFMTPLGHTLYFSGGDGGDGPGRHQGVGVAIGKHLLQQINQISFSALSGRVLQFQFKAAYFPTTWRGKLPNPMRRV